ncbi:uncharacterized protein [Asterias amurensis]|uniref:uncharacterized protein n=1 Tax=Asterias amurensis TaxID=7602 RepID=UPI003AB37644
MGGGGSRKAVDKENPLFVQGEEQLPSTVQQRNGRRFDSLAVQSKLTTSQSSLRPGTAVTVGVACDDFQTGASPSETINFEDYVYPFENIVFEGGGNKGLAYAGAVRVLEKAGVWPQIRKLGGASAGAMWAVLLGVGYTSHDVEEFLSLDLKSYFLDASCGLCTMLPNLMKYYGWHPARKLYSWFGDRLEQATGFRDITFKQVYDTYQTEICIVVTNVNLMDAEYCHVKTTPNMSVRMAARMSMAIPGLFCAVQYSQYGRTDLYVDGGLLCNYPIHCFDGWWLSMKPEDSILRRLQPLEDAAKLMQKNERFSPINDKTIGLLLYSSDEQDLMVDKLATDNAYTPLATRPDTKLSRERKNTKSKQKDAATEHKIVTDALAKFIAVLSRNQMDNNTGSISRKELETVFNKEGDEFTDREARILFGENFTIDDVFEFLDINGDGTISFQELMGLAEQKGVSLQTFFLGYQRQEVSSLTGFLDTLSNTLLVNVKRVFTTDNDLKRTIGIDTLYVSATDFKLEEEDRKFLVQQGELSASTFLTQWIKENPDKLVRKQHVPVSKSTMLSPNGQSSQILCTPSAEGSQSTLGVITVTPVPEPQRIPMSSSGER